MIKKWQEFINEEVGVRNLTKILKGFKNAEIYFHKDFDGIATAIALKEFLSKYYDVRTVDSHIIQYGNIEFCIKNKKPGNIAAVCDFAHSKPMFTLAFDHHDKQTGAKDTQSTYFKPARSNAETISGEISYSDLFTPQDIELIKTIDSANFVRYNLTPEDIQNSLFTFNRNLSGAKNRFMMGLVVNRLVLAYKNKRITVKSLDGKRDHINKNFLECLVLDCSPSLYSIFINIRHYIDCAVSLDKAGKLAKPEQLLDNLSKYIDRMKNYKFVEINGETVEYDPNNWQHKNIVTKGAKISKGVHFDERYKIISQYGGGRMFDPGSYDRYVPFKNFPKADFIAIVWPMGLIQVSCNPFREKRFKDINLGDIAKEVMSNHEMALKRIMVTMEQVKHEFETSDDWRKMQKNEKDYEGVGFRFSDLDAFYGDCIFKFNNIQPYNINDDGDLKIAMNKTYSQLTDKDRELLSQYKIPVWELIIRNSGGHPSITNLQGFNFLKYNKVLLKQDYGVEKYTEVMKKIAREFINNLRSKIDLVEKGEQVVYNTQNVEFKGQDTNE